MERFIALLAVGFAAVALLAVPVLAQVDPGGGSEPDQGEDCGGVTNEDCLQSLPTCTSGTLRCCCRENGVRACRCKVPGMTNCGANVNC
jgi:hypothetical protein